MNLTILFDLDDTLLDNNIDEFIPAYIHALSQHMQPLANADLLIRTLLQATDLMVHNIDPQKTLKQVFDTAFYPDLGIDLFEIKSFINQFYKDVFPQLRRLTKPMQGAKALIEEAFARGYNIAIATNPLFPRTAILQRLEWADLSVDRYQYKLIPSYETFHFAKPNPAFFSELLANLGWPIGSVIMVGDDYHNDIVPAQVLGINVYWVGENSRSQIQNQHIPRGDLDNFLIWLDEVSLEYQEITADTPQALLAILEATPAYFFNFLHNPESNLMQKRRNNKEWSLNEIFCHMKDVESEVNLPRIDQILDENNPFIPGKDTDAWSNERNYHQQDGYQALIDFINYRKSLLDRLRKLTSNDWDRRARHAILGPTTLFELVKIISDHDRLHIQQIHQVLYT